MSKKSKKNYDNVAEQEFMSLPADYQKDWGDLRSLTLSHE
jgi:hypothetical protein